MSIRIKKLENLLKSVKYIDSKEALYNTILTLIEKNGIIKNYVISLLQAQLWKGQDMYGNEIKTYKAELEKSGYNYALSTIQIKKDKKQPYDRVTLKDTGQFYNSIKLGREDYNLFFYGIYKKIEGDIRNNVDLDNVMNLQEQNKILLVDKILQFLYPYIKKILHV